MRIISVLAAFSSLTLFAGEVHNLIADKETRDEAIEKFLIENPGAIADGVPHPALKPGQEMGVLEAAVSANRWDLVCWLLDNFPKLDENKPLGTLENATVLGYAIKTKAPVADRILKLCPGAEPIWNWNYVNKWEVDENKYLRAAAAYKNWPLFRAWADEFSATRMAPALRVWGNNGSKRLVKKSILGAIVEDKQYAVFADVLTKHLDPGMVVDVQLMALAEELPLPFKKAVWLELMRRTPGRLQIDSDWMTDNPIVVELRQIFNHAAWQLAKEPNGWRLPAVLFICRKDRDLKEFEAIYNGALDALVAKP